MVEMYFYSSLDCHVFNYLNTGVSLQVMVALWSASIYFCNIRIKIEVAVLDILLQFQFLIFGN